MKLCELVTALNIQTLPDRCWAVLGPEADAFRAKLHPAIVLDTVEPALDGILLAGALSGQPEPLAWLEQISGAVKPGSLLVIVDWQADGPLDYGPELERRFKHGRLRRRLRESGFGIVETLQNHSLYYVVRAIKGPAPPIPNAGEFVDVASLEELPKNAMKPVNLFGEKIIVANTGKEVVAFAQACPHANSSLDKGKLRGRNVICASHGYIWNVQTGEPVEPADEDTLPRYPVKVDTGRGRIWVALAPPRD